MTIPASQTRLNSHLEAYSTRTSKEKINIELMTRQHYPHLYNSSDAEKIHAIKKDLYETKIKIMELKIELAQKVRLLYLLEDK